MGRFQSRSGGRKQQDGKYLRVTGLWASKKRDGLWSGKLKEENINQLQEKLDEASKAGAELMVFLWENTERDSKQSPEFTIQVCVAEEQEGYKGGFKKTSKFSKRDEREEVEEVEEEEATEEVEEEEDEKPARKGKVVVRSKARTAAPSKRDKSDW